MTDTLTVYNSLNNIENFFADINSPGNTYYFFVARPNPWANSDQPPIANNSYSEIESVWSDLVFGKLISNNNLAYMAVSYPWVSGTAYSQYDQASDISGNFYVVTSDSSVYKCIDNNGGANSTIQPSLHSLTGTFQTSDGYTWKYMYTIPTNANNTFNDGNFIPVVPNTFVSNNAIPGSIDVIRVLNGGNNWQGYLTGQINSIVSATQVQISNGNPANNFYVGSSIYIAGGLGGGQIRQITGYNGSTQTVTVNSSFSTIASIQLASPNGSFNIGYQFIQTIANVSFLFLKGSFNANDSVVQSEVGANGKVAFVNSSSIELYNLSQAFSLPPNPAYPIIDTGSSITAQTGLVTVTSGANQIIATTANLLNIPVGTFIQVGSNNFNNVRRVTSVTNSSTANVSVPWTSNLVANIISVVSTAFEPLSETTTTTNGNITFVNLNGLEGSYGNVSSVNQNFIIGEFVELFNSSNVSLAANAIVAYANNTTIILSNTNGTFTGNNFLYGTSSNTLAQLFTIQSYPTITVSSSLNTWQSGIPAQVYNNGLPQGSATILGVSFVPSPQTPFVISPTVNINGDGSNALAYAVVNNAPGSSNNVDQVIVINTGINYTVANVNLSANSNFGSGGNLYPVIAPANGHGSDALSELGATYAGISMTVNTFASENFFFPPYGSYRRTGIIKNPLYQNINLTIGTPERQNVTLSNSTGNFVNSEIVLFNVGTFEAGVVVTTNSTFLQLKNISNAVTNSTTLIGLISNTTSNATTNGLINFTLVGNSLPLFQEKNTNQMAVLTDILSNTSLLVSNVSGKLLSNAVIYDPSTNAYANILSIISGVSNVTANFGNNFSQISRVSLSQNSTSSFQVNEEVVQMSSGASGLVISANGDLDLAITNASGTFSSGTLLTDANTSANGTILWANSTYIKLTGVTGKFYGLDRVSSVAANANISQVYTVLTLANVSSTPFQTNAGFNIIGQNSGAIGVSGLPNTISTPSLVRSSGEVLYVNDSIPFTINTTSKEAFLLVLSF